jgi:WD40 repeat protein
LHRFLKSANVLLDHNFRAKLSDLGLASIRLETKILKLVDNKSSHLKWLAPELFKRKAIPTKASDVYSYGIVLWEIASRKIPFSNVNNESDLFDRITKGVKETIPPNCPQKIENIIRKCWLENPIERPVMQTLVIELEEARSKVTKNFIGHQCAVTCFAFLPEGILISGSWDNTVRWWKIDSEKNINTIQGFGNYINALSVLPNNALAVGCDSIPSQKSALLICNAKTGVAEQSYQVDEVKTLAPLKNGMFFLRGNVDFSIFDTNTQKEMFKHYTDYFIYDAIILRDQTIVTTCGTSIEFLNPTNKTIVRVLEGHADTVTKLAISKDEKTLVSGSSNGTINVWDPITGILLDTFSNGAPIFSLAILNSRIFATGGGDGKIKLWDRLAKKHLFEKSTLDEIRALAFHKGLLFSGCYNGSIFAWDCSFLSDPGF